MKVIIKEVINNISTTDSDVIKLTVSSVALPGVDGEGVAPGGTTGQVLAKKSDTDYDTEWVNQSGGSGGSGDMDKTTYDPRNINADVFDYDNLTGAPTIPADISDLNDDTNLLFDGAYNSLTGTPDLKTVATSGKYTDLTDQPTIPTNNNQLINGAGYITSASLPNVSNFITASSTDTFTNKSGNISQWTNDSNYLTSHQNISGKEDTTNKVTAFNTPTDIQYPSAKLVKDQLDTKQASLGFTPENSINKDSTTTLGTSNDKYPTQNAVKTYVDNNAGLPYSGTSKITVSSTQPNSPNSGDIWIDLNG